MRRHFWTAKIAVLIVGLSLARAADAEDWSKPHSWRWPLYKRVEQSTQIKTGEPRPAVWTSSGELQKYGTLRYLHPGIDIRGDHGDPVIVPADAELKRVFLYQDDCLKGGNSCRVWFQVSGTALFAYVSHVDLSPIPKPGHRQTVTEIREKLQNAASGMGDTAILAGQKFATLTMFGGTPEGWHHIHFGVFDQSRSFAMREPTSFLAQVPKGETGEGLVIVDDEAPMLAPLLIYRDGQWADAISQGACGDEAWGKIDIIADAYDTFFDSGTYAGFPGKGTLSSHTGIARAQYVVRANTGQSVASGTWFDLSEVPLDCVADEPLACMPSGATPSETLFFERMALEDGAPSPGLTILQQLFDVEHSKSEYFNPNGEQYFHIFTNAEGLERSVDLSSLAQGRYQVSVEVSDFYGNKRAGTRFITVHDPSQQPLDTTGPGFPDVYLRDNNSDIGEVPSTLGGKPFWVSPDIFVVPKGTPVTVDSPPMQSLVTAGIEYDVYVRVHNDSCVPVKKLRARVVSSNPSAINTDWSPITSGFVGNANIPAGDKALLGPFSWTPSEEEAQHGGHRCLLAAVDAPADPLATGFEFNAPDSNNVTQRNLQISYCRFALPNPTSAAGQLVLTLETDAPVDMPGVVVEVTMPYDASWKNAWASTPGVESTVVGSSLVLRLRVQKVVLPQVSLPAGASREISFRLDLPANSPERSVSLAPNLNGQSLAGVTCSDTGRVVVPR